MRVAVFTDNDFVKVNGVTTTLTAVLKWAPADLKIRIYTASDEHVDDPDYLALASRGAPIPFYGEMKIYVPRVREYIRRARADRIDVIHMTTPGPVGLAAMRVARRLGLPMVGSFHTDLAAYTTMLSGSAALGAVMRHFLRWPYGRCTRVLVPSESTRRLLAGANGDPDRIATWVRGVDCDAFSPDHRSQQLRAAWGVHDRRPALLYVGRVSREKGLGLLPDLQARLHALGVNHRFVIAGDGPMLPELRSQLVGATFTGALSRSEVARAFASADVFVFPSRTDTAGNVVLEAQASGLPVLVSDAGGPKENMVPDQTGVVVAGTDPGQWAAALAPLARDPARRRGVGECARAYAATRSWHEALAPLYQAYRELGAARDGNVGTLTACSSGSPMRITSPSPTFAHSSKPAGATTTIVEPWWK
jgi:glycosyltransferase involved in cell wall biosynthesis